jgi:hypothetical protein
MTAVPHHAQLFSLFKKGSQEFFFFCLGRSGTLILLFTPPV